MSRIKNIWGSGWLLILPLIILESLYFYQNLVQREVYFGSDNAVYAILAKRFLEGDFFNSIHAYWNPGFPLVTIPFYLLSGSWETAQVLVSMTAIILLTVAGFMFFRRISVIFALIVSFLLTFSASLQKVVLSGGITEPLYILLLWTALFFSWLALNSDKLKLYVYTAVFFALAYLTRTEVLPIFVFFLATTFFIRTRRLLDFRKIGITLFVFFLICTPYIIIQSMHIGRLTLSGKYAYIGSGPYYALEKYRPTTWAQDVWAVDFTYYKSPYYDPDRAKKWIIRFFKNGTITQNAIKSLKEIGKTYQSINTDNFFVGWGIRLAIIGFIISIASVRFRLLTLYFTAIWVVGVLWVATFMPAHYRYLVFALPFFVYLQAVAIYLISKFFGDITYYLIEDLNKIKLLPKIIVKHKKTIKIVLFLVSIALFLGNYFSHNMTYHQFIEPVPSTIFKDYKMIGDWIKSQNITLIGGRMEGIEFYSGAKIIYMPSSPPEEIVKYMKAWGVEYLLVRPFEVGYDFVRPIADPKFKHPDLTLYHQFSEDSIIWKIRLTEEEKEMNQRKIVENQYKH